MVEDIIKAVNKQFVYVSKKSFDEMKITCKKKLLACQSHCEDKFKAFFNCEILNESQFIELLEICHECNIIFLGFIREKKQKTMNIYNHKIYSGETIKFYEDILFLQDIPKDCYIESSGNILVLGCVKGNIELIHKECTITASSFDHANICIFDSEIQNTTYFSCSILYYENKHIIKEEHPWDYVLASPLVKVE